MVWEKKFGIQSSQISQSSTLHAFLTSLWAAILPSLYTWVKEQEIKQLLISLLTSANYGPRAESNILSFCKDSTINRESCY